MNLYYEARKQSRGDYLVERPDPGLQTLAVVDFTNSSIDDKEKFDPLRWGLASLMINQLSGSTNLKVIERERLRWLLDELELQRNRDLVDEQTAVRAGRLLGATGVLFGTYMKMGRDLLITTRLVKVETGEVLIADQERGRASDFLESVTRLSKRIADAINVTLALQSSDRKAGTQSLDAMIAYSEGLRHLDERRYEAAYVKFVEALEFDSDYEQAQKRLESLRPLIESG